MPLLVNGAYQSLISGDVDWPMHGHMLLECVFPVWTVNASLSIFYMVICQYMDACTRMSFFLILPFHIDLESWPLQLLLVENGAYQSLNIWHGDWSWTCADWSVFFLIWTFACYNFGPFLASTFIINMITTHTFKVACTTNWPPYLSSWSYLNSKTDWGVLARDGCIFMLG